MVLYLLLIIYLADVLLLSSFEIVYVAWKTERFPKVLLNWVSPCITLDAAELWYGRSEDIEKQEGKESENYTNHEKVVSLDYPYSATPPPPRS